MPIQLVPLGPQHVDALDALVQDPAVLRFTRVPDPVPEGFGRQWLQSYDDAPDRKRAFAVEDGGEFLGIAVAPSIDDQARTVELGYIVARHARGRGVASDALDLLTTWALHELGMLRLELLIGADNAGSQAVARRCGYTYEGTRRSAYMKPGRREDTQVWSLLPTDPRPAR